MAQRSGASPKRSLWMFGVGMGLFLLAVFFYIQLSRQPEPPGMLTQVYMTVVHHQATARVATDTPAPPTLSVDDRVASELAPTETPEPTATPLPTHTLRPSGTPNPGVGTVIHEGVVGTQAVEGTPTFTPGPLLETFIQRAIEGTLTAGPATARP